MATDKDGNTVVSVEGGKYKVILKKEGGMKFLRHDEPWEAADRDFLGSKFIYCLAAELDEAREKLEEKGE